mmetsp:Transcript_17467/g.51049  ORF Transcript_17467/g.51049 Transcript_17467/m.51049 type:complete len:104 (-) Transcript_17467:1213-1524(-)
MASSRGGSSRRFQVPSRFGRVDEPRGCCCCWFILRFLVAPPNTIMRTGGGGGGRHGIPSARNHHCPLVYSEVSRVFHVVKGQDMSNEVKGNMRRVRFDHSTPR